MPEGDIQQPNHSRVGPLIAIFVVIFAATALLFLKNPLQGLFPQKTAIPVVKPESTPAPQPILPPPAAVTTSALETPTMISQTQTYQTETTSTRALGETVQFFLNNDIVFHDPKNPNRRFTVTVVEFTDSRCPKGVTCIWTGELGARVRVRDQQTGQTQEVSLGMLRNTAASALGLRLILREIDEGKGGTYADMTVQ